jgi:hypothetical protein
MMAENLADPYDAVLADLNAKRAQIEQAIAVLTALREGRTPSPQGATKSEIPLEGQSFEAAGQFLGMSIVDATKKLLAARKRAMGNADILADLKVGGLVLTSNDPLNVVSSVLMRRFKNEGDIVRVERGIWGLKEWYPGRNFKPTIKATTVSSSDESDPPPYTVQINDLGGAIGDEDDL